MDDEVIIAADRLYAAMGSSAIHLAHLQVEFASRFSVRSRWLKIMTLLYQMDALAQQRK